jgi:hypothetical protein
MEKVKMLNVKGYEFWTLHIAKHQNSRERFIFMLIAFLQLMDSVVELITIGHIVSEFRLNFMFGCDCDGWIDGSITFIQLLKTFNDDNV